MLPLSASPEVERWAIGVVYLATAETALIQSNLGDKVLWMLIGLLRNGLNVYIKTQSGKLLECGLMGRDGNEGT